jgi:hypothetical protein
VVSLNFAHKKTGHQGPVFLCTPVSNGVTGSESEWSGRREQHPVTNSFITNIFSDPDVTEWTRLWTQVFGLVNAGR